MTGWRTVLQGQKMALIRCMAVPGQYVKFMRPVVAPRSTNCALRRRESPLSPFEKFKGHHEGSAQSYRRSLRSLMATRSARKTTTEIRLNPTTSAVDQEVIASVENAAAVITAIPTAVPIR